MTKKAQVWLQYSPEPTQGNQPGENLPDEPQSHNSKWLNNFTHVPAASTADWGYTVKFIPP